MFREIVVCVVLAFSMFVGLLFVHCTCSVVHVMWSECCSLEASVGCEYLPISLAYLIKGQHNMFLMNIHNHSLSHTHTHTVVNYTCKYVFASMCVCVCVLRYYMLYKLCEYTYAHTLIVANLCMKCNYTCVCVCTVCILHNM